MKLIALHDRDPFKIRDVIRAVASQPNPGRGIDVAEMRQRCRLLDALEKAQGDSLALEDADHALLVRLINAFQFATAHPQLLAIVDDVVEAKIPQSQAA